MSLIVCNTPKPFSLNPSLLTNAIKAIFNSPEVPRCTEMASISHDAFCDQIFSIMIKKQVEGRKIILSNSKMNWPKTLRELYLTVQELNAINVPDHQRQREIKSFLTAFDITLIPGTHSGK